MTICRYKSCEEPPYVRGLCQKHYTQSRRGTIDWRQVWFEDVGYLGELSSQLRRASHQLGSIADLIERAGSANGS